MEKIWQTASPTETEAVGEWLAKQLNGREIIAFSGGMGMGKTAFIRGLARGLGVSQEVSSPTFALVHQYDGTPFTLYHFDMYRVETWEDLNSTGFYDYIGTGILAIEWSENIRGALSEEDLAADGYAVSVIDVEIAPGNGAEDRTVRITLPERDEP